MSIEIRKDFEGAGPGLLRLVVLADTFAGNDDQWSHLRNREDFEDIYQLPRPTILVFDRLYAEGRDLALAMARDLVAFNSVQRFPTLGSFLDMMDKWVPHLAVLEGVVAASEAESGVATPWAVRRMLALFNSQTGMFREALRVVGSLRQTALARWETDHRDGTASATSTASAGPDAAPVALASSGESKTTVSLLYTHDNDDHKAWVKSLADRLTRDGFHVGLDQYDLGPGDEMSAFMEALVAGARFKVVVCSANYVEKTNALKGGAGYEKAMLARSLVKSQSSADIVPIIRNNSLEEVLPNFLGTRLYIDFRDDTQFEARYVELWRKLKGMPPSDRPLPASHLDVGAAGMGTTILSRGKKGAAPESGDVTFDYSDNDGFLTIEVGGDRFDTKWSSASNESIHAYREGRDIDGIALADEGASFEHIVEPGQDRWSSRARTARVGEIVLWRKKGGALLATRIDHVEARSHGARHDVLTLTFHLMRGPS